MGIFGSIFGTEKAVDNILDKDKGLLVKFGSYINNIHYSDAEKAESAKDQREWAIRQLDALAPFKVVQRILAFAAAAFWIFTGVNVLLGMWIEAYFPEIKIVEPLLEFALSDYVFYPVLSVFALYFSGGVVDSFKRKSK